MDEIEGDENEGVRSLFDGRAQYHRLALAIETLIIRSKIERDYSGWLDGLASLYDHSETFFSDTERTEALELFTLSAKLLSSYERLASRREQAFKFQTTAALQEFKNCLHLLHRSINRSRHAHGLLLPISSGESVLDVDNLMRKMGISTGKK